MDAGSKVADLRLELLERLYGFETLSRALSAPSCDPADMGRRVADVKAERGMLPRSKVLRLLNITIRHRHNIRNAALSPKILCIHL